GILRINSQTASEKRDGFFEVAKAKGDIGSAWIDSVVVRCQLERRVVVPLREFKLFCVMIPLAANEQLLAAGSSRQVRRFQQRRARRDHGSRIGLDAELGARCD